MFIRRFLLWLAGRIVGEGVVLSSGATVIEKDGKIEILPSLEDAQAAYSVERGYKLALEPVNC